MQGSDTSLTQIDLFWIICVAYFFLDCTRVGRATICAALSSGVYLEGCSPGLFRYCCEFNVGFALAFIVRVYMFIRLVEFWRGCSCLTLLSPPHTTCCETLIGSCSSVSLYYNLPTPHHPHLSQHQPMRRTFSLRPTQKEDSGFTTQQPKD